MGPQRVDTPWPKKYGDADGGITAMLPSVAPGAFGLARRFAIS